MKRLVTSPIILAPFLQSLPLVLGVMGSILVAGNANAQQDYGDKLKAYVESDVKLCFACHDSPNGGGNKGQKFFTDTLKGAGWQGVGDGGANGLSDALDKVKGDKTDTDGDKVDDIAELAAGANPSDDTDTPGGASGAGGGGASGAGGGSTGGGGGGDDDDDDDDDDGGSSGNPGTSGQATSAGCSYGVLDSTTKTSTTAALVVAAGLVASLGKRRKRR
jgi:hypothetical protein